jgi:isopenicillin-N N-acyltransferase like protein
MHHRPIPDRLFSFFAVVALAVAPLSAAEKPYPIPAGKSGKGELKTVDGVPVMFLEGTPEEIGRQHGKLVGAHVRELIGYPKKFLKAVGRERQWPLAAVAGKLLLLKMTADHRAELQAAITASGLDADSVVVANTMLELRRMGGCSTLIVGKDRSQTGQVLFGRNFDFPPMGVLDKYGLVTVYRPKGKRAFVSIGFPGLLGVISGINDAGLCVATLDVYGAKDGSPMFDPAGQPMMFTFRRILEECKSVKEAHALLKKAKATTWMNLAVADPDGGTVFELTPKTVVPRKPDHSLLACTNHFRSDALCTSKTCRRYAALIKSRAYKKLGLKDLKTLMHDANQRSWTIQTMIFEPAAMKLHVSLTDPPTSNKTFRTLDVRKLLAVRRPSKAVGQE